MDTLLSEGLGERATSDLYMARDVCFALLTLNTAATTVLKTSDFKKKLTHAIRHTMTNLYPCYFPISTNQLAVLLTECLASYQIS